MSHDQFVGRIRASREINGLLVAETEYPEGLSIDAHPHDEALCCLVLEGAVTERWGHRRVDCEPGRMTYLPPSELHSQEYHVEGSRCFLLQFGAAWSSRMAELDVSWPVGPLNLDRSRASWIASQMYREFQSSDAAAGLAIEGFALTMLGEVTRAERRRERGALPGWLIRVVELLHARMSSSISMAELAEEVDVHPTHLARTFKAKYGCTMGEYLRRIRIEWARSELATTSRPISAIALDAGFSDQAHFTRAFKRMMGDTPAAWRAMNAEPSAGAGIIL